MSEMQVEARRRRAVWILAAVLTMLIVGLAVFFLVQRGQPRAPVPSPTPTAAPSPSPSPSAAATPSPTATGSLPPAAETRAATFADAMTSGNTAALEQELANPIFLVRAASDCCGDVDPVTAISAMAYVNPGSGATWNFAVDEATLTDYRSGEYAQYFPVQALVGVSSDGHVVSFIPASPGGLIETLLMAVPGVI